MSDAARHDAWAAGEAYEALMGRWSRRLASRFVDWLGVPPRSDWLDLGCGTGALSQAILDRADPASVTGLDPSGPFVSLAARRIADPRARFRTGDATATGLRSGSVDAVASALVLNFLPDRPRAYAEMMRVARSRGTVGAYVWDYPGRGMGMLGAFWQAAEALSPEAAPLTERVRFAFCTQDGLVEELTAAGLREVRATTLSDRAAFAGFEDFWHPLTLGAGPAGGYVASLEPKAREALRERLKGSLGATGPFTLPLRAHAVAGRVPG